MDFLHAARNESVVECLQGIEDKLYERGFLVTATGDSEADVTISFKLAIVDGEEGPYQVIDITCGEPPDMDSPAWEEINDYVDEKWSDLREGLPEEATSALSDIYGIIVNVNGKKVY